jgi:drug/metabolite transporter (DMT)-like permease
VELGIALTLIAAVGWGAGDVFARKAMFGASAATVLASMITLTIIALGIVGLLLEGPSAFAAIDLRFLILVAIMGGFTWVTGNLLYFHGMKRAGVIIAAPILGAAPLAAIGLAIVFGGEDPNAWVLLGAILIVLGVGILMTDRNRVLE